MTENQVPDRTRLALYLMGKLKAAPSIQANGQLRVTVEQCEEAVRRAYAAPDFLVAEFLSLEVGE